MCESFNFSFLGGVVSAHLIACAMPMFQESLFPLFSTPSLATVLGSFFSMCESFDFSFLGGVASARSIALACLCFKKVTSDGFNVPTSTVSEPCYRSSPLQQLVKCFVDTLAM